MDLYLFPESTRPTDGYKIAVAYLFFSLNIKKEDVVVWYTNDVDFPGLRKQDIVIHRPSFTSIKRYKNLFARRETTEVLVSELAFLKNYKFDRIHCDDVIFYNAIRTIIPNQKIIVRFHNCFSRISHRNEFLKCKLGMLFNLKLYLNKRLEQKIFMDSNCEKIFISEEDYEYYTLMTGMKKNASTLLFKPKRKKVYCRRIDYKLVWFGGVEAHKYASINWFINEIFPQIKVKHPLAEFHLWGKNTELFDKSSNAVYGHGFFDSNGVPFNGNALFINPDIIGGGVKIKLLSYFENGLFFITTPFGFEGYDKRLIDDECRVVEPNYWIKEICEILER